MLTVEDYGRIRKAHSDGMSIRAIARTFHHSRRKIQEVLADPESRPYTRTKAPPTPFTRVAQVCIMMRQE